MPDNFLRLRVAALLAVLLGALAGAWLRIDADDDLAFRGPRLRNTPLTYLADQGARYAAPVALPSGERGPG